MTELDGIERAPVTQGVIITDCCDPNAQARLQVRFTSLFDIVPTFIGVEGDDADLAAAGHLVDVLDAAKRPDGGKQGGIIIQVNAARRGDEAREKWDNGTPFCYAEVEEVNATVVSTFEGRPLSLAYELGLISVVHVLDIPTVAHSLVEDGTITTDEAEDIINTQFRSLRFQPLAARLLVDGRDLQAQRTNLNASPNLKGRAWFVDSFGNIKTTSLPQDVGFEVGKTILLPGGQKAECFGRLADVPNDELGLTIGSSGYGRQRLLELAIQKGRAADELGVKVGSKVLQVTS